MRRRLVLAISAFVLLLGCGKKESAPAETRKAEEPKSALIDDAVIAAILPAAPCVDAPPADAIHLGDGVTSYNYYVIAEELQRRPGSAKQTREALRRQGEAQLSTGMTTLKPPSANVVESEFSHLLGAIMDSNGGIGAAVFDKHGLKIGAAGLQLEAMVLTAARLASVALIGASDAAYVERYTCNQLSALATNCDPKSTKGISCWDLEAATGDCKSPMAAYYRPVFDDNNKRIGVSMFVVEEKRPCSEIQ